MIITPEIGNNEKLLLALNPVKLCLWLPLPYSKQDSINIRKTLVASQFIDIKLCEINTDDDYPNYAIDSDGLDDDVHTALNLFVESTIAHHLKCDSEVIQHMVWSDDYK